jgi:HD-like signal output (HDOD) protein
MEDLLLDPDKTGAELSAQRFQILADIAKDMSGDVVFPTCFDVSMRLRQVLNAPNSSIDDISKIVAGDPLISSKLVGMANSVAFNPGGDAGVRDLHAAIVRLGLKNVRMVALGVAVKQMAMGAHVAGFNDVAHALWDHSVRAAGACQVIARRMTRLNHEDAFFAGLVHDVGAFYMLYRAAEYDELRNRPESLKYLVVRWHESVGETLLAAIGVPEAISEATRDHDQVQPLPPVPRSLGDVLHAVTRLIGTTMDHVFPSKAARTATPDLEPYLPLLPEIGLLSKELLATFA